MANDSLKAALAAFRAETHGRSEQADAGLDRLLAGAEARKVRRLPRAVKWLPLAAALAASSAWAALGTDRTASMLGFSTDVVDRPTLVQTRVMQRAPAATARSADETSAAVPEAPAEAAVETADAVLPRVETSVRTVASAAPSAGSSKATGTLRASSTGEPGAEGTTQRAAAAPGTLVAAPAAPASEPTADSASVDARAADTRDFKDAYRIHDSGSPAASIDAFDRYLRMHPTGRFVPEARYARAVALVRAGRNEDARRALMAFADAPPGSYRREDAARVLRTLPAP